MGQNRFFFNKDFVLVQAPPRADVVKGLRSGIMVNLLGMGAAILGMQATVGFLVAKALTTSANPFYQGVSQGYSPVLALDVFLVQVNALLCLARLLMAFKFSVFTWSAILCRHRRTPCFLIF